MFAECRPKGADRVSSTVIFVSDSRSRMIRTLSISMNGGYVCLFYILTSGRGIFTTSLSVRGPDEIAMRAASDQCAAGY